MKAERRQIRLNTIEMESNVLFREFDTELFPLCKEEGVGVIVYNPLAGGFLTGKYHIGEPICSPHSPGRRPSLSPAQVPLHAGRGEGGRRAG
ncbi:MAG: aldo/keto reductase [Dehalococcoidia bacterium]